MTKYSTIANCNYESADDDTIHRARKMADRGAAPAALVEALDDLEETLNDELTENGEYRRGVMSQEACNKAEAAVIRAYAVADLPEDAVIVETMPDHLRGSHRAAGNWGVYPHNGADRQIMSRDDAESVVSDDEDGYNRIVHRVRSR